MFFLFRNMQEPPVAHSTPKILTLLKRPGIRDNPISTDEHFSTDEDLSEQKTDEIIENTDNSDNIEVIHRKWSQYKQYPIIIAICSILLYVCFTHSNVPSLQTNLENEVKIEDLKEQFGSQEDDFWISVQELVKDSIKYNHPKSLILLYDNNTVDMIEHLLEELSKYALCKIAACSFTPIFVESSFLEDIVGNNDHGSLIAQFKDGIYKNGVMIVKNIEDLSGKSAMVFQSLCDEFQPKALFVFTLKIEQQFEDKNKYVEMILREKWRELNDDIFYPLLTRISSFIFVVQDNKN